MKTTPIAGVKKTVWHRLLRPEQGDLPAEAARFFLRLKFDPDDLKRMHQLTVKNQEGALNRDEEEELREYRHAGMQLDLLRAKARRSLLRTRKQR